MSAGFTSITLKFPRYNAGMYSVQLSEKAAVRFPNMDFTRIYLLPNRNTLSTLFVIICIAVCNGDCQSTKG
jgi:hypothetical protein